MTQKALTSVLVFKNPSKTQFFFSFLSFFKHFFILLLAMYLHTQACERSVILRFKLIFQHNSQTKLLILVAFFVA